MATLKEKVSAYVGRIIVKYWHDKDMDFDVSQFDVLGKECRDAYLAGAKEALASQWREIGEDYKNIPPKDSVCLCHYIDGGYAVAIFDGIDEWTDPSNGETYLSPMWNVIDGDYVIGDEITHWMPIQEPPKSKKK